jgi:hypothetical protein
VGLRSSSVHGGPLILEGVTQAERQHSIWSEGIWVADKKGTLLRIDPTTDTVRQKISIPPGSYNPLFGGGVIWITGLIAVS